MQKLLEDLPAVGLKLLHRQIQSKSLLISMAQTDQEVSCIHYPMYYESCKKYRNDTLSTDFTRNSELERNHNRRPGIHCLMEGD